jgi:hypothetical protein
MPEVLNLHELAERVQLPAEWLKAQAKAGRLPHLRVGRSTLFNPVAVTAALAAMAAEYPAPVANKEAAHATA